MACGGLLTSMLMTVGASLLKGVGEGLIKSSGIGSAISKLGSNFPGFNTITEAIGAASGQGGTALISMGGLTFPGVGNAVPSSFLSNLGSNFSMTGLINNTADQIMGVDLGVFTQHFNAADALVQGSNQFITALQSFAGETFSSYSQNSLMTGALTDANKALPSFGTDMFNVGNIVNLADLNNLGNPLSLVKNLSQQSGGLAVLNKSLLNAGIDPNYLNTVLNSTDVGALTNATLGDALGTGGLVEFAGTRNSQDLLSGGSTNYATLGSAPASKGLMSAVYDAMANIKGEDLAQVQAILGSNVSGLVTMQDMLDPGKILPNSFPSLASIPSAGTEAGASQQSTAASSLSRVYV